MGYYPENQCDYCGEACDELYDLGTDRLCWDCYQDKLWSDEMIQEHLDGFIESHKDEYLIWLFRWDSGTGAPSHGLLDKREILDMFRAYYPIWLGTSGSDYYWRLDFAQAGGWEEYVQEVYRGKLLCKTELHQCE